MPVYNYYCPKCEYKTEQHNVVDKRHNLAPTCPNCNIPCQISIGRVAVIFKGSGFAINDSRADKHIQDVESAMDEGITSKDEMEAGIGMLKERAKERGIDEKRLLGGASDPKPIEEKKEKWRQQVKNAQYSRQ